MPKEIGQLDVYTPVTKEAIVVIGAIGDESVGSVTLNSFRALTMMGTENNKVQAYRVEVGKPFRITAASYLRTVSTRSRYLPIDGPALTPSRSSIYYYGTIYTEAGRGLFSEKVDPRVIALLKKNYPQLLTHSQPQNFKLD